MASSVTSRVSCPARKPVWSSALATALDTSPRRSWWMVQLTPSWMLGDQLQAFSQASIRIHRVSGPMSPLTSAWGIRRAGEMRPWVGCCQRTRASMPRSRPVDRSTTGRYSRYGVPTRAKVGSVSVTTGPPPRAGRLPPP